MQFTGEWFFDLEQKLTDAGLDSDEKSFDEIKSVLQNPPVLKPDEFASTCAYVILAGGFSQKTAKKKHIEIMFFLAHSHQPIAAQDLLKIFNNKNKINAIVKIWLNRCAYRDNYYSLNDLESKLNYLATLPHIGKITANHLARNLGIDVFKPDVWIVRLADKFFNGDMDAMFAHLQKETNLPRGYIDVVLWKAAQNKMIEGL
jgi:hypothetical protein